jgi:hypothetical protein
MSSWQGFHVTVITFKMEGFEVRKVIYFFCERSVTLLCPSPIAGGVGACVLTECDRGSVLSEAVGELLTTSSDQDSKIRPLRISVFVRACLCVMEVSL